MGQDSIARPQQRCRHEIPIRTLAYRLMPNHWHFVLWRRYGTA